MGTISCLNFSVVVRIHLDDLLDCWEVIVPVYWLMPSLT